MKYQAKPIQVDAFEIIEIGNGHVDENGPYDLPLTLSNGDKVVADRGMVARYLPLGGDYYVIQSDGYAYINPKDVFERKYQCVEGRPESEYKEKSVTA